MKNGAQSAVLVGISLALGVPMLTGCGSPAKNTATEAGAGTASHAQVETALDAFVADLMVRPTRDDAEVVARIRAYLDAHPGFYGSTVAAIGPDGKVTTSPYVYQGPGGLQDKELAVPGYDIDQQAWLARPRDTREALWSDPYFDAGGGEIWMVTRSVPMIANGVVTAVVTTDLPVDPPKD